MDKKKSRKGLWIAAASVVLLAAAAAVFFGKYTIAAGEIIERDAETVDVRGSDISAEELETVEEKLPDARIYWDITIGGKTFDGDSTAIVTADFTEDDIPSFQRLTELQSVDASACTSASAAIALRDALPGVDVFWNVTLDGTTIRSGSESAEIRDASADEIRSALAFLPEMKALTLTNSTLTSADQLALAEEHPDVTFRWAVTLAGKTFACGETNLDYSGTALDESTLAEIEKYLPCLPTAESIDFTGCGLSDDALKAFADRHDGLAVVWDTELFGVTFSTSAEEIDFTDIPLTIEDAADIEAMLPYMPNLQKVIMCRCGISNEDMEELYNRHDDVWFVWMVQVYSYGVRTDQTYFTIYNCEYNYNNYDCLAENLRYCHAMEAIDLGHMHTFGDTYFFSQMPHLKYLVISQTSHTSIPELADCKELVYLEAAKCSMTDITPLLGCPNIKDLNIVYKRVHGDAVAATDMEVLSQMTQLEHLYIGGNMYSDEQVQFLRDSLPNTEIVINTGPETGAFGWREMKSYFDMRDAMHMYYMDGVGNKVLYNPYTGERSKYEDTDPFD